MSEVVIKAENLGKSYIEDKRQKYKDKSGRKEKEKGERRK